MNQLTPEDIRHFIYDRTVADNELEMDLFFSDEEIARAMRFAAATLNSMPPISLVNFKPENMPFHPAAIHCVIYHLYLSRVSKLVRNDVTYTAGDVHTDALSTQIKHLKEFMGYHRGKYEESLRALKDSINIKQAYGVFC